MYVCMYVCRYCKRSIDVVTFSHDVELYAILSTIQAQYRHLAQPCLMPRCGDNTYLERSLVASVSCSFPVKPFGAELQSNAQRLPARTTVAQRVV